MQFFKDVSGFAAEFLKAPALQAKGYEQAGLEQNQGICMYPCTHAAASSSRMFYSLLPVCLCTDEVHPFSLAAGNFLWVISLFTEQYSNRTVTSYNLNKRSCVSIWLLFKYRHRAVEMKVTEVPELSFYMWCVKWGSHVHRHLIRSGTVLDDGRLSRPLKMFFLVCHSGSFPVSLRLADNQAESQHRYPAVRMFNSRHLRSVDVYFLFLSHVSVYPVYSLKKKNQNQPCWHSTSVVSTNWYGCWDTLNPPEMQLAVPDAEDLC